MKLLFVADPLEHFKIAKDSTFAMMREAAARGHTLLACGPEDLRWQRGGKVMGLVRDLGFEAIDAGRGETPGETSGSGRESNGGMDGDPEDGGTNNG